jgi:LPS sulfotransferase NodH
MMAATGTLGKPDEYFRRVLDKKRHGDDADPLAAAKRSGAATDDILSRVALAKARGTTANGICSFKLFLKHFEFGARQGNFLEHFPDIRFIWIYRHDLLGQAISFALAKQTKKFRSYESRTPVEPDYDRHQIEALIARIAEEDAAWRSYFARAGIEPLRLCYEDFASGPMPYLKSIGKMVDVPIREELPASAAKMKVQRDDINRRWRERFLHETNRTGEHHLPLPAKSRPTLFKQVFGIG